MLSRSFRRFGRFFDAEEGQVAQCVTLRNIPTRWWEGECKAFLVKFCGVSDIPNIHIPLDIT